MPISKKINFHILLLKNKNPGDWMKYKSSKLKQTNKKLYTKSISLGFRVLNVAYSMISNSFMFSRKISSIGK